MSPLEHDLAREKIRPLITRQVIAISTDYRDPRKAAYQEYVVTFDFNAVRLPPRISYEEGSTLGVAFVAASLALGICMGVDFTNVSDGPDLLKIVKAIDPDLIPEDVRAESLNGIPEHERARAGDWLAIWGGESRKQAAHALCQTLTHVNRLRNVGESDRPARQARRNKSRHRCG